MTTTARKPRRSPSARKAAAEKSAAERTAIFAQLDQFKARNEQEQDRVTMARILAWMTKYSERNAELIVMQAPEATDIRGYRQWQSAGRQVRKGETGIRILAPAGQSDGAEPVPASDNTPAVEGKEGRRFFRLIPVFDVSQTDPIAPVAAEGEYASEVSEEAAAQVDDETTLADLLNA